MIYYIYIYIHDLQSRRDNERSIFRGKLFWRGVHSCICFSRTVSTMGNHKRYETRVPGLGQITWWIMMIQKMRGHSGEKIAQKSRNSCRVNGRGRGCIGTVTASSLLVQFGAILEPNPITGIFPLKKICRRQPAVFFWESLASRRRCLDDFFGCFDLPKINVFSGQTIQNFKTLTPPLIFWNWESFHSLPKNISWWW